MARIFDTPRRDPSLNVVYHVKKEILQKLIFLPTNPVPRSHLGRRNASHRISRLQILVYFTSPKLVRLTKNILEEDGFSGGKKSALTRFS